MESRQVFKTYDGVDVSVGDFVYKCWKTGKHRWYDQPSFIRSKRLKIYDFESDDALFFKHKKNATAYVKFMNDDSMPKPTTINSIEDIGKIYGTGHIIMHPTPTPSNNLEIPKTFTAIPNGQMATENKSLMGKLWDDTMKNGLKITNEEWEQMFSKPIVPSDNSYQLNISGSEHTQDLHSILTQFSHAYNIPINTVLEFIVNKKSK
jgi:hypothetical protein